MSLRVYKLAKQLGLSSKDLIDKLKELKVEVSSHMSSLDEETAEIIKHELSKPARKVPSKEAALKEKGPSPSQKELVAEVKKLEVEYPITVKDLSVKLSLKPSLLIKRMMEMNIFATINQSLPEEIVKRIAREFEYEVESVPTAEELLLEVPQEDPSKLLPRAPIVTLMGHVDHGKTSLLDAIRKSKITEKETGGITQHIGAYEVFLKGSGVTFLDTPGHEAFTAMRARGANVTDVVVLVVAADDGVMPQTIEAIDHARAAEVPIVVAINKIDKPNADIERVKRQLAEHNLVSEEWGGKTIMAGVSAKTHEGIDNLLEMLLLEAELLELKANPQGKARGVVVEGRLTKDRGPIATVLVKRGTLRLGDVVISSLYWGKVRAMINDRGNRVREAPPSSPVEILGLSGVPLAGEAFYVVEDERKAREIILNRQRTQREKELKPAGRITLEQLYQQIKEGKVKELKIILKADVQGSLEALSDSLQKLSTREVQLKIIHSGVGDVNESDIILAVASNAVVIGFHVGQDQKSKETAHREAVEVRLYRVIYEAIEEVRQALEGMLEPRIKRNFLGRAIVRQIFRISKVGIVGGCLVEKGRILRGATARLLRSNEVLFEGKLASLKRFKDDVREVQEGLECGIGLEGYDELQVGDVIEVYTIERIARKLE